MDTTTIFKNVEATEFFHYNHVTGQLTILVDDGSHKGLFVRSDTKSAALARQFHTEEKHGVPYNLRQYIPLSVTEYADIFIKVMDYVNDQFRGAMLTVEF